MTKAAHKITLSPSRDIPFNRLVLSQANVRQVKAGMSIEELAEDIARRTLLQSLNVRPVLDEAGQETGMFEIPAGGRRYRALELLVNQKRLSKTALVPCVVRDARSPILAEDDSLAENIQRAPLHPLDQYQAFATLRAKGQSDEDIAAAFFVGVHVVKQRLRLAAVSPKLLEIYREEGMTLEQLMAFTVSTDHDRQEKVWANIAGAWNKAPFVIKRQLTEDTISAANARVRFVGLQSYEQAGGTVMRDLFSDDANAWITDINLLDRLVAQKLQKHAEEVKAEGWLWVEAHVNLPHDFTRYMRPLPSTITLSQDQKNLKAALDTEYQQITDEYEQSGDDVPEDVLDRLTAIGTELSVIDQKSIAFDPAEIATAGAFVHIDHDGVIKIRRGFVRMEDRPIEPSAFPPTNIYAPTGSTEHTNTAPTVGGQPDSPSGIVVHGLAPTTAPQNNTTEDPEDEGLKPLSESLLVELSASRTLALRHELCLNPDKAMTALLHKLVLDAFFHDGTAQCLEIGLRQVYFTHQPEDVQNSLPAREIDRLHQAWIALIPQDHDDLWNWLHNLDDFMRGSLLAHCVALGVNALYEKPQPYMQSATKVKTTSINRLANAVNLDMLKAQWQPTVANYLGRVPKARILEAVREAKGDAVVQLIEPLKKVEMAREAERLLHDTGWLPEPLRSLNTEHVPDLAGAEADAPGALPDFLDAEDEEALCDNDDERPHVLAAE